MGLGHVMGRRLAQSEAKAETKTTFKARIMAEGRWSDFVKAREDLVRSGVGRPEAWKQMMADPRWGPGAAAGLAVEPEPTHSGTSDLPEPGLPEPGVPDSGMVEITNEILKPVAPLGQCPGPEDLLPPVVGTSVVGEKPRAPDRVQDRRRYSEAWKGKALQPAKVEGGGATIGGVGEFEVGEDEVSLKAAIEWVIDHLDCEEGEVGRVPNRRVLNLWKRANESDRAREKIFERWFDLSAEEGKSNRMFSDDGRDVKELLDRLTAAAKEAEASVGAAEEGPW